MMKQFLGLFCFLWCLAALADHDEVGGYNYNGRTFSCTEYKIENFTEIEFKKKEIFKVKMLYTLAFCQLHRGGLAEGIATLKQLANMEELAATIILAEYYTSDEYILPREKVTNNEVNLQKAIDYREQALRIIRSRSNYPFDGGDGFAVERVEKEEQLYLKTASNLLENYIGLFPVRIFEHMENMNNTNTDIGDTTLEVLRKAMDAANSCLAIPYNSDIWSYEVYEKYRGRCLHNRVVVDGLLRLENNRLHMVRTSHTALECRKKLKSCMVHTEMERDIYQFYNQHVQIYNEYVQINEYIQVF